MNIKRIARLIDSGDIAIKQTILEKAQKDKQIIYGARAINAQLPTSINKDTEDYDILTKKPKKSAKELVEELNKKGKNKYYVEKAMHKGTFKVKDINGKTVVDYTQLRRLPKTTKYLGNDYYDKSSIKRNIAKSLNKKENDYRLNKDKDTLQRIKLSEMMFDF